MYDICVIGFGVSGISFTKYLKKFNLKYIVFEKYKSFGGIWNNALETTTLQTHKKYYQYEDFPMPKHYSIHPSKKEILEYLNSVIQKFQLNNIYYNHNVVNNNFDKKNNCWIVEIKNNNNKKIVIKSKYLIICNGYYNKIKNINISNFNGKIIHFNNIKNYSLELFNNKKIVIIGNGASACDFLNYIKKNNNKLYIIYKKNKYYIKKYIFNISTSIILNKYILLFFKKIPLILYLFLFKIVNYIFFDNYLDIPNNKVNCNNLIANNIIPKLINEKKLIYIKDKIKYPKNNNLILENNIILNIDYIILCNGYKENYNFFNNNYCNKYVYNNRYKQIINPYLNNCAFIGQSPSYNWLINSYNQSKYYIDDIIIKNLNLNKKNMLKSIEKYDLKQKNNGLKYNDLTYELFEYF